MLVGLALVIYTALEKTWGMTVVGVVLILAGLFADRMTGPFDVGNDRFHFRGRLSPPTDPYRFRGQLLEPAEPDTFRGELVEPDDDADDADDP